MGGKSTSQTQTSQSQTQNTQPYAPTIGPLNDILGQIPNASEAQPTSYEQNALSQIQSNSAGLPDFMPQASGIVSSLLGGGGANNQAPMASAAYDQYKQSLAP